MDKSAKRKFFSHSQHIAVNYVQNNTRENGKAGNVKMAKNHFHKSSQIKKLLMGKGFYLALAVCLVAVGGVAVVTFMKTLPTKEPSSSDVSQTPGTATTWNQQVDKPITNVPDDRTTTTTTTTTTTARPVTTTTMAQPANTKPELYILPLSNEVIKRYSDGEQVFSETMNDWRTHNGVDFKGEENQEVKVLADGTILSVEEDPLWGSVVVIDHGYGVHSRYCGVTTKLETGAEVKLNDVLGTLSVIPCEQLEEPHLHLEIFLNDQYQDPVKALGRDVKYTDEKTTATAAP